MPVTSVTPAPRSVATKQADEFECGVRIVAETAFWSMIGVEVS